MKIDNGTLVLVVDGSRELLLRNEGDTAYPDLRVIAHHAINNPPDHEQMSDAPGLTFSSSGVNRSTYEHASPQQEAADRFAADAARELGDLVKKEAGDVIVVAPPKTLGVLRRHYGAEVQSRLIAEIASDLTKQTVDEIARHLESHQP